MDYETATGRTAETKGHTSRHSKRGSRDRGELKHSNHSSSKQRHRHHSKEKLPHRRHDSNEPRDHHSKKHHNGHHHSRRSHSPKRSRIEELKGRKRRLENMRSHSPTRKMNDLRERIRNIESARSLSPSRKLNQSRGKQRMPLPASNSCSNLRNQPSWTEALKGYEERREVEKNLQSRSRSRSNSQDRLIRRRGRREMMRSTSTKSSVSFGSVETFETEATYKTIRQYPNPRDIEKQIRELDEALVLYGYAERAAVRIQQAFRERLHAKDLNKQDSVLTSAESDEDIEKQSQKGDNDDTAHTADFYTWIFLALFTLITVGPKLLMTCWNCIQRLFGGDVDGADVVLNTAMTKGGGGPVGPTPAGAEVGASSGAQAGAATGAQAGAQAGAQGLMAAQAASSAASGAASGVASSAAAGAAASSAAAAATAGVTVASVSATQVATIVAVSTAAVAATSTVVANPAPEPILSTCGLVNPDIRNGQMVMFFEELPRTFDKRESGLIESLMMDSYNGITFGANVAVTGCLDPLAREVHRVSIVNQTLHLDSNKLEVVFEAQLSCDRCSVTSPLFSEERMVDESANSDNRNEFQTVPNATTEGVLLVDDEASRQLLPSEFSSQRFLQKVIQLIILGAQELVDEGELPQGAVQMSKALVVTSNTAIEESEEESLVTEVKYKRQPPSTSYGGSSGGGNSGGGGSHSIDSGGGSRENPVAAFEFAYVDNCGQVQRETVEVTQDGAAVPTTAFPTFQPSHRPSSTPTSQPTTFFSGQPTPAPSAGPSKLPSRSPSSSPSDQPSRLPSGQPSVEPSESPSQFPSVHPSNSPSLLSVEGSRLPTREPSSRLPTREPSDAPSYVGTIRPTHSPREVPSYSPSSTPSIDPSGKPSRAPSMVPSFFPSDIPSRLPSNRPSTIPSSTPSSQPTATEFLIRPDMIATQSSIHPMWAAGTPNKAIDGNTVATWAGGSVTHTDVETNPWWQVDIGEYWGRPSAVKYVTLWNRYDGCCFTKIYGSWLQLLDANGAVLQQREITSNIGSTKKTFYFTPTPNVYSIRVQHVGDSKVLHFAELEAWGYVLPP